MTVDEHWEQCDVGTIQQVADNQLREEKTRLTRRSVVVGALASVTALTLVVARTGKKDKLTCPQILALANDFVQDRLDERTVELVKAHRTTCPSCDDFLTRLSAQTVG